MQVASDCANLEYELWEIDQRILLRRLEFQIAQMQNKLDYTRDSIEFERGQQQTARSVAVQRIVTQPRQVGQHVKQLVQDIQAHEANIARISQSAAQYTQRMKQLREQLALAVDEAGRVAGPDLGNKYADLVLIDLEKLRTQIEDALMRCYAAHGTHINGRAHDDPAPYVPGFVCWCGQEHGPHSLMGLGRCWCGVYNEHIGVVR